jgi:hypothetical protein
MRAAGSIIGAAVVSSLVAAALIVGAVYLKLGISLGPHQQFEVILLIVVQVIVAIGTAAALAIVLAAGGDTVAVGLTALALALFLMLALGALEAFGLRAGGSTAFSPRAAFDEDLPFLGAIAIPGLTTILIQWWSVRCHLLKARTTGG